MERPFRGERSGVGLVLIALGFVLGAWQGAPLAQEAAEPDDAPPVDEPISWWLRLRSTGYAFEQEQAVGVGLDRFGAYQEFDGVASGIAGGRVSLHAAGRFADDLSLEARDTDRERLYAGYIEVRPDSRARARLGRQFLQEGAFGQTMDGLFVQLTPRHDWEARAWGGGGVPRAHQFEIADLDEDAVAGARVGYRPMDRLKIWTSLSYRERAGRVASRPAGLEAAFTPRWGIDLRGRAAYDLERELWSRAEAIARWRPGAGLPVMTAQLIDRFPDVDGASYFARFAGAERARVARSTVRYETAGGFGGEVEYLGAFVEERTSTRVGGAILVPVGRVGYSVRIGDSGEENRWYGDAGWDILRWLRVEASASFSTYAILEDAPELEEHDLTSASARLRAVPRPGLGVVLEVQSLDNPLVSEDIRVLGGVDLTMGRGTSRFGLDHGPWLQGTSRWGNEHGSWQQ